MKKFLCIILSAMLLVLCACSVTDTKTDSESFGEKDLAIVIDGVKYSINDKAADLLAACGEPTEYSESESCAYDGMDKYYYYVDSDGVYTELFTIPLLDGMDTICELRTNRPDASTPAGISVGSSLADVIAAYGENYTVEDGTYFYWAGQKNLPETPTLYFVIENDTVAAIGIYSARNFG